MHVISVKEPVEIRGWDSVLSVGGIFLYRKLIHAEGIISFGIVQLFQRSVLCVRWLSHRLQLEDPREVTQGNKRLGGLKEGICYLFSLWVALRDCTESWIACELKLCVIMRYFHLYDNTEIEVFSWGFPQSILLCSCVIDFSFSIICVLFDLAQNWLSFHKFDCRSRLSILL